MFNSSMFLDGDRSANVESGYSLVTYAQGNRPCIKLLKEYSFRCNIFYTQKASKNIKIRNLSTQLN